MSNSLIIVESPAKVKTIKKFLGKTYTVDATMGHLIDMPKSSLGVDVENGYEPKYITIRGKGELLSKLKKEAKKADKIYLATDPDREGEAISWHLKNELDKDASNRNKISRITFNEITKNAVKNAIKSPRDIDMDLVNAQQARRVIDRLVGYTISPLLWKKIRKGLSAGRVQSVALRMICDREAEIAAFTPEEYWSLDAHLLHGKKKLTAAFYGKDKKMPLPDEASVDDVIKHIGKTDFTISDIKKSERRKKAPLPFTTSTMQQEAAKSLGFATSKTMKLAQTLYEDGYITYLRTDSTRISVEADAAAKIFISDKYGEEYVNGGSQDARKPQEPEVKIQDAHEAIRPTDLDMTPEEAKAKLQRDEARLYTLVYKRFLASRMTSAVYDTESVKLDAKGYVFTLNGSKLKFDGFLSVYMSEEDKADKDVSLPEMKEGEKLSFQSFDKEQHFTQPPAHYTEASLVKTLEEDGIGRPSTYAPTIGTLLARRYITKEKKNIFVTELGQAVDDMMQKNFPTIVDTAFTANMESLLDTVANGNISWKTLVENFYPDLSQAVEKAHQEVEKITIRDEETDIECDKCGRRMVIKYGPHGKFLACPGFPECMNTKPYVEYAGFICPDCGSECVKRRSKKGRIFYSCSNYPECNYMTWNKPKEATAGEKKDGEIMC
ncbi:DNA topoisomerase-1 [Oribacterium sp. KHPX15]|uniref:type I DNA topoisomerase n=1 Tax=unclassified Oribacterium TaxID=2629782 RepID=UPI0004E265CD|nr:MULTISPECIES: type I DNA topoisomerase [unclassified Oribacterium]SDZ88948.1 DNA topoisomerase-1 [Oribacterium sp. KHPX15]